MNLFFSLYLAGKPVGRVIHDDDDQPFHLGRFDQNPSFAEFEPLFREQNRLSAAAEVIEKRLEIRDKILALAPKLMNEASGQLVYEPLALIIEDERIRWRGIGIPQNKEQGK